MLNWNVTNWELITLSFSASAGTFHNVQQCYLICTRLTKKTERPNFCVFNIVLFVNKALKIFFFCQLFWVKLILHLQLKMVRTIKNCLNVFTSHFCLTSKVWKLSFSLPREVANPNDLHLRSKLFLKGLLAIFENLRTRKFLCISSILVHLVLIVIYNSSSSSKIAQSSYKEKVGILKQTLLHFWGILEIVDIKPLFDLILVGQHWQKVGKDWNLEFFVMKNFLHILWKNALTFNGLHNGPFFQNKVKTNLFSNYFLKLFWQQFCIVFNLSMYHVWNII